MTTQPSITAQSITLVFSHDASTGLYELTSFEPSNAGSRLTSGDRFASGESIVWYADKGSASAQLQFEGDAALEISATEYSALQVTPSQPNSFEVSYDGRESARVQFEAQAASGGGPTIILLPTPKGEAPDDKSPRDDTAPPPEDGSRLDLEPPKT